MTIIMIKTPQGDEQTREIVAWLGEHGIPANDAYAPSFVDTDARLVYWRAAVYPAGAKASGDGIGGPMHDCLIATRLPELGLDTVAPRLESGRLCMEVTTPLLSTPPEWAVVA